MLAITQHFQTWYLSTITISCLSLFIDLLRLMLKNLKYCIFSFLNLVTLLHVTFLTRVSIYDHMVRKPFFAFSIKNVLMGRWIWHVFNIMYYSRLQTYFLLHNIEMFYLNTIVQLFLFVEQLDQLEVCLSYSRLLAGIQILAVFQNLRWNSNKTSLVHV